jgi:hypothetical protein
MKRGMWEKNSGEDFNFIWLAYPHFIKIKVNLMIKFGNL